MFGYEDKIDCNKNCFEKNQLVNANDMIYIKVNGLNMTELIVNCPLNNILKGNWSDLIAKK